MLSYHVSMPWQCSWTAAVCPSFSHYLSLTPLIFRLNNITEPFLMTSIRKQYPLYFFYFFHFSIQPSHRLCCSVHGHLGEVAAELRGAPESAVGQRGVLLGRAACRRIFSCMCLHTRLSVDVSFSLCCCFIMRMILGCQ